MDSKKPDAPPKSPVTTLLDEMPQPSMATLIQGLRYELQPPLSTSKECLRLRGLPDDAKPETIIEFLGQDAEFVTDAGVHIIYTPEGQPSGEAIIQMKSEESAFWAVAHTHNRYMVGQLPSRIEALLCTVDEMKTVLTSSAPGSAPTAQSSGEPMPEPNDANNSDQPPVPTQQQAEAAGGAIPPPTFNAPGKPWSPSPHSLKVSTEPVTMLRVHNLPSSATEHDIMAFFNAFPGLNPYGVYMMGVADRHFKGSAFVALKCEAKYVRCVLDRQCNYICNSKIDLCIVDTVCALRWLTAPSRAHLCSVSEPPPA